MANSRLMFATLLGAAVLFSSAAAQAAPLFDFLDADESGIDDNFSNVTLGYSFNVSSDITVDGIGLFDYGSDGLSSAHEVALWDAGGNIIISPVLLNPGSPTASSELSASGLGSYIYESIADVVLGPGNYVLGASYLPANGNKDPVEIMPDSISAAPSVASQVMFGAGVFGPSNGVNVMFPFLPGGGNNYFGPALRVSSGLPTVPEPMTLALMVIGLIATLGVRRQPSRHEASLAA